MRRTKIGTFKVQSGALVVTDPCYSRETTGQGLLKKVKNGRWAAFAEKEVVHGWGDRVTALEVKTVGAGRVGQTVWKKAKFHVGVDSGQVGVFDEVSYPTGRPSEGTFYDDVCALTCGKMHAGVIPFGAASSSGFGDGCYGAFIAKNDAKEVVGVRVVFIKEDELKLVDLAELVGYDVEA